MRTIALLLLLSTNLASAQEEEEDAAARALFQQGVEYADQEQWGDAADRFGRALELRWAAPIAFNLADAQSKIGRLVEASEHLNRIRRENPETEVAAAASVLLETIRSRLAHLEVTIEGGGEAEIRLDDRALPPAMIGVEIPVDPGSHTLVAMREQEELTRRELTLAEGAHESVSLEVFRAPTPEELAQEQTVEPPPPPPPPPPPSRTGRRVGIAVGAVAVVAIAVVLAVVLSGSAAKLQGDFEPGRLEGEGL